MWAMTFTSSFPQATIVAAAEVIERMESRYPEHTIANAVLLAVTAPGLGDDRYVRLADVKGLLRCLQALSEPIPDEEDRMSSQLDFRAEGAFTGLCSEARCDYGTKDWICPEHGLSTEIFTQDRIEGIA